MNQSISRHCPKCHKYGILDYSQILVHSDLKLHCPTCQEEWGKLKNKNDVFDRCPACPCRQFYIIKDFNQFLGCGIMLIGIIFVPFTYGISLPILALLDWTLHRKAKSVICCYRCGSEFRGFGNSKKFKPFLHHIGLRYDKYR